MMRTSFLSELKELKTDMLQMGAYIEEAIKNTMEALKRDDLIMAQEVINKDCIIDDAEKTIENLCLKLLLTQQPVATDMRMISSALKMITDMERITKGGRTGTSYNIDFVEKMGEAVIRMVDSAILSFTNSDLELAKKVCKLDDEVDSLFNGAKNMLLDCIRKDESLAERALDLMLVSKYLERIGDHATNIAEWVIFSITGVHVNTEN